jgi:hypothetical protein
MTKRFEKCALLDVALGAGLGAYNAPAGHRMEGVGRGGLRGLATGTGAMLGGAAGAGAGMALAEHGHPNLAAITALLGLLGGGVGGYKLSGKLLGKPSYAKKKPIEKKAYYGMGGYAMSPYGMGGYAMSPYGMGGYAMRPYGMGGYMGMPMSPYGMYGQGAGYMPGFQRPYMNPMMGIHAPGMAFAQYAGGVGGMPMMPGMMGGYGGGMGGGFAYPGPGFGGGMGGGNPYMQGGMDDLQRQIAELQAKKQQRLESMQGQAPSRDAIEQAFNELQHAAGRTSRDWGEETEQVEDPFNPGQKRNVQFGKRELGFSGQSGALWGLTGRTPEWRDYQIKLNKYNRMVSEYKRRSGQAGVGAAKTPEDIQLETLQGQMKKRQAEQEQWAAEQRRREQYEYEQAHPGSGQRQGAPGQPAQPQHEPWEQPPAQNAQPVQIPGAAPAGPPAAPAPTQQHANAPAQTTSGAQAATHPPQPGGTEVAAAPPQPMPGGQPGQPPQQPHPAQPMQHPEVKLGAEKRGFESADPMPFLTAFRNGTLGRAAGKMGSGVKGIGFHPAAALAAPVVGSLIGAGTGMATAPYDYAPEGAYRGLMTGLGGGIGAGAGYAAGGGIGNLLARLVPGQRGLGGKRLIAKALGTVVGGMGGALASHSTLKPKPWESGEIPFLDKLRGAPYFSGDQGFKYGAAKAAGLIGPSEDEIAERKATGLRSGAGKGALIGAGGGAGLGALVSVLTQMGAGKGRLLQRMKQLSPKATAGSATMGSAIGSGTGAIVGGMKGYNDAKTDINKDIGPIGRIMGKHAGSHTFKTKSGQLDRKKKPQGTVEQMDSFMGDLMKKHAVNDRLMEQVVRVDLAKQAGLSQLIKGIFGMGAPAAGRTAARLPGNMRWGPELAARDARYAKKPSPSEALIANFQRGDTTRSPITRPVPTGSPATMSFLPQAGAGDLPTMGSGSTL